ncbi:hypothetical protein [Prevotella sp. P3-122]|uniref:hypothetical protein n=1 Tax=Prevotella sp. P3-122 TaxID=2024223 RepID=UPI0011406628|nr:hypothetical protein [Prevotella sp. P3-122]
MKIKKRLLHHVWLFAILMGWTSLAHAQTDVTSKYIKNAGFEESPVTYTKASGTTAQTDRIGTTGKIYTVTDWTYAGVCNNNAVQIATIEYGFESAVDGTNSTTPPTADNLGQTGTALAISAGWGDDAIIEQETTLPPGVYSLTYYVNNQYTNTGIAVDFTGVKFADGTTKTGTLSSATQNTWTEGKVYFSIAKEQKVTFRVGFTTSTGGSGNGAKLYVDNLKLLKYDDESFDMTSWIANAGFEQGTETTSGNKINKPYGWNINYVAAGWLDGSINTTAPKEGTKLYNAWAGQITSMDIYQEIGLPVGKYRLSGDLRIDNTNNISDQGVYATYNGNTYKSGTITNVASTWNSIDGWNTLSVEFYINDAPDLTRIGISGTGEGTSSKGWFQVDNIQMQYLGKNLRDGSTQATSGVSATANTWYAIQVPIAGTYQLTSSAGTLYYTQNGELMPDDENAKTTSVTEATDLELTAGYLYINSTEASTVTLVANNKTYNVGNATPSISYIQAGQTVTVTYADATTNDTEATFAKLTGDVTLNNTPIDVTISGNSFTFTVPEGLSPATNYDLVIPAGAFGYEGQTTCAEQTITFTTPAVFDGTYFIKATDATYISRGARYGTEAARDPWGIAIKVATDNNNVTTFTFIDNEMPLGVATGGDIYTDNNSLMKEYTLSVVEGGYTIKNNQYNTYVTAGTNSDGKPVANTAVEAYVWTLITPDTHATEMDALKNDQAVEAVNNAKTSGATGLDDVIDVETLKTALLSWPEPNAVELPALNSTEFYQASGTRSAEVTITKAGLYKFSMPAYNRPNNPDKAYSTYQDNTDALTAYIFIGDAKTQVRSLYSETGKDAATTNYTQPTGATQWWPNQTSTGTDEFNNGKYVNEVWVWLDAKTYSFGISHDGTGKCGDWIWFGTPTLTLYSQNLYPAFSELYEKCKPWTESATAGDYVATYNSYASYADGTDNTTLQEAINYLKANFDTYAWDNASLEHPYDTKKIVNPTYDDGTTGWDKTQNSTGGYSDGIDSNGNNYYYTASSQVRHATIFQENITLKPGAYRLSANMYGDILNSTSTYIYATDGAVDHWSATTFAGNVWKGYLTTTNKWTNVSCYIVLTEETTLRIGALSWGVNQNGNTKGNFRVDDWKLEYVKYFVDNADGVLKAYGEAPLAEINSNISANTNVVDLSETTGLSNAEIKTTDNPNTIIYAKSGAVSNSNNVVVDGSCANLVLTDGHPFKATKQFTASNASYTMTAVAGGKFGTLMLPFAVTTLPGKAYSLDQGVIYGGDIYATEVNAIAANSPVLVTAKGDYTATDASVAATADTNTNGELVGTYKAMTAEENSFVLQKHGDYVAFFMVKDTKPTVNPFRAYIKAQSGAASKEFVNVIFDSNTTGISNVNNQGNADNDIIYDLSGRRVNKAHKGVYIINGKKIVK